MMIRAARTPEAAAAIVRHAAQRGMGTDRLTRLCGSLGALSDNELRLQGPSALRSLDAELAAARDELERYLGETQRSTG